MTHPQHESTHRAATAPSHRQGADVTAQFVLVPGAGCAPGYWWALAAELRSRGHEVVAVDLPCQDEGAGLGDYAQACVAAIGDRSDVVLVAHSFGAFTAPLVCERASVQQLVLLSPMIPAPQESAGDWWEHTGQPQAYQAYAEQGGWTGQDDTATIFFHDLSPAQLARAEAAERHQAGAPFGEPWPLGNWPAVPTRVLAFGDDRLFPLPFQRRLARERLGLDVAVTPGGHMGMCSHPAELAGHLAAYAAEPHLPLAFSAPHRFTGTSR